MWVGQCAGSEARHPHVSGGACTSRLLPSSSALVAYRSSGHRSASSVRSAFGTLKRSTVASSTWPSDVPNGSLKYNQENPKKRGSKSWHRYESYKKATTVDEYFRLQGTLGDLKYDFSRGFFKAPPALARWCASK